MTALTQWDCVDGPNFYTYVMISLERFLVMISAAQLIPIPNPKRNYAT